MHIAIPATLKHALSPCIKDSGHGLHVCKSAPVGKGTAVTIIECPWPLPPATSGVHVYCTWDMDEDGAGPVGWFPMSSLALA